MCTRVFNNFNNENKYLTTARNMDWATQMPTTIFAFKVEPNELTTKSGTYPENQYSLTWTARYSSIVTMVGIEAPFGASDGINSEGLVANLLYDSDASYEREDASYCKNLDVLRWVQFVLDTCCSVKEVVFAFSKDTQIQIQLIGGEVPGTSKAASLHLSVSDKFGDSAIIEVHRGRYIIYHNPEFRVMTNEPSYAKQIELNQFWRWQWNKKKNNFPSNTLPGGPFPSDRFARASYYLNHLFDTKNITDSLTQSKSVVMNASVPVNFESDNDQFPNIAQTLWTTIACHNNLKYYFSNTRTMGEIYMDLNLLQEFPSSVSKLVVISEKDDEFINQELFGYQNENFEETVDPFTSELIIA